MSQKKNINSCVNYSPSITRAPKQKITVDMYDDMQNDDILLKKRNWLTGHGGTDL